VVARFTKLLVARGEGQQRAVLRRRRGVLGRRGVVDVAV